MKKRPASKQRADACLVPGQALSGDKRPEDGETREMAYEFRPPGGVRPPADSRQGRPRGHAREDDDQTRGNGRPKGGNLVDRVGFFCPISPFQATRARTVRLRVRRGKSRVSLLPNLDSIVNQPRTKMPLNIFVMQ
ncbi:hypothetical protein JCM15519_14420 [Fundidesulfovibrio butyratiphilus]